MGGTGNRDRTRRNRPRPSERTQETVSSLQGERVRHPPGITPYLLPIPYEMGTEGPCLYSHRRPSLPKDNSVSEVGYTDDRVGMRCIYVPWDVETKSSLRRSPLGYRNRVGTPNSPTESTSFRSGDDRTRRGGTGRLPSGTGTLSDGGDPSRPDLL